MWEMSSDEGCDPPRARLDEPTGQPWVDRGELSDEDKRALDATLATYEQSRDAGSSWDDVKARVQMKLRATAARRCE
jgi:hypothetical protein